MKIAVVTDSGTGWTMEQARALGLYYLPLQVKCGDEEFLDGVDLTVSELYARLKRGEMPTTSMPPVGKVEALFEELKQEQIDHVYVNGSREHRHPGNANLTFEFIEGEAMLLYLDMNGIAVSTGSACSSASLTPSHVLSAMGVPVERIHGTLRLTVGDMTTKEDIDYVVSTLKNVVNKLREISSVSSKKGW